MTLRLILIRHAKSSWDDPFSDDHARVLNRRGKASAVAVGDWLTTQNYVPDVVYCSDAARAKETAALILAAFTNPPDLFLSQTLYHAAPDTALNVIRKETAKKVAIVGHNPGIGMLANMLVQKAPSHNRFGDYPTCGTTVIDFDLDSWRNVQSRLGRCEAFVVPRDLIGTSSHDID